MNQALVDRVLRSPRLPSLPSIAIEVIDLVQQKDVNIKQIAHTISHDPALSSKILKTVNSSFYGQAHSISTISHALVVLGLNSVKTLALGFSLVTNLKEAGGEGFNHVGFWKRSLYSAVAARSLAKQFSLLQQEEAFLGALLQDLGMLAMNQTLGAEYQRIVAQAGADHFKIRDLEQQSLGTDHAEIGALLAQHWNLPPVLLKPIRYHEEPAQVTDELQPLVRCVALSGRMSDVFVSADPAQALETVYTLAGEWCGLTRDQTEPLLASIHKNALEMRRLCDMPETDEENADQILARANETLLQLNLQAHAQTNELEQQNRQLAEQAVTDSLTGAANRRRFNEFIAQQFDQARASAQPLSLLFLDTDKFKKFNDTYGHQTGDRVLVEVASVLKRLAPRGGLVARYGGEEFAVVLPATDRITATRLAEATRRAIEETTIASDEGKPLNITASIGVATHEGMVFIRAEQLVKAADQGVYAAKSGGRNCVRIFSPRPKAAGQVLPPGGQAPVPQGGAEGQTVNRSNVA